MADLPGKNKAYKGMLMTTVGQIEKRTQARIVTLFQERLGYDYLGDKTERDNRNIEPKLLTAY